MPKTDKYLQHINNLASWPCVARFQTPSMLPPRDKCLLQRQEVLFVEWERDSWDRLISGCTKCTSCCPHVPLDRQSSLPSLCIYQPVLLPVLCFSNARLRVSVSVFATCGRSGPVYVHFYGVCSAIEVEHWPQFLFSTTPEQLFSRVRWEQLSPLKWECKTTASASKPVCVLPFTSKCVQACSALDWLPVSVITSVHVINANGQDEKLQ